MINARHGLQHRALQLNITLALAIGGVKTSTPDAEPLASGNRSISYEVFDNDSNGPILILLHGASGPEFPLYRDQAKYFSTKGYVVFLLNYFDAADTSVPSTENYVHWTRAVQDLIAYCKSDPELSSRKIALMGFSLGASVALAAGSQRVPVQAIADWYGSLPDDFFYHFQGMPPLLILHGGKDNVIPVVNAQQLVKLCQIKTLSCEDHIYPKEGHGFQGQALEDADNRTIDFFIEL
jgi:dienelactone hydrolase